MNNNPTRVSLNEIEMLIYVYKEYFLSKYLTLLAILARLTNMTKYFASWAEYKVLGKHKHSKQSRGTERIR